MENALIYEEMFETVAAFLALYGIIVLLSSMASIVLFVLQGLGLYEMSNTLGIKNAWMSFVPVLSVFSLGRIAERYIKQDGKKSAKFSVWLAVLLIAVYLFLFVLIVVAVIAIVSVIKNANTALDNEAAMTLEMFSAVILIICAYFIVLAIAIAYRIIYFVALWRVFSIFDNNNTTLFTILSVFFTFMGPIFLFVIRKKQPKLTFEERMGIIMK